MVGMLGLDNLHDANSAEWLARNGYPRMAAAHGMGSLTRTGLTVNESTALNCSVVNACIRVISDPIGFLPLQIYERVGEDRLLAKDFSLYRLLHDAPNPWMTATTFRQLLQAHLLTHGNCYSQIIRRSGTNEILQLLPMDPRCVAPQWDGLTKSFKVTLKGGQQEDWGVDRVWHTPGLGFDGIRGYSVITMARESIALSMAMEGFGAAFFGNGGRIPYVLKLAGRFKTDEEFNSFKARTMAANRDSANWNAPMLLEGGAEYEKIGTTPEDAQFLVSREFQVLEIARWYKVSPHKLADLSRATFSNIEHLNIEFLTETLSYWLKLWEQSIWLSLLDDREKDKYYAEFNADAILRGDAKSQADAMSTQIQNGLLTPNEGRKLFNRPAVTGGDTNIVQLNMQSLPGQEKLSSQEKEVAKGATPQ